MHTTKLLTEQHRALEDSVRTITELLNPATVGERAFDVMGEFYKLSGRLVVHLAMEDKSLYPDLLLSTDLTVQQTARRFISEMGGIALAFDTFMKTWCLADKIKAQPADFVREAKAVFAALARRISAEEQVLYPLLREPTSSLRSAEQRPRA